LDRRELGPLRVREDQGPRAIEERRLRPRRLPNAPGRLDHHGDEQLLPVISWCQRAPQRRAEPVEALGIFPADDVSPRGQPMPERIAAGRRIAFDRARPGAAKRVAAVGGDLGGGGHDFAGLWAERQVRTPSV